MKRITTILVATLIAGSAMCSGQVNDIETKSAVRTQADVVSISAKGEDVRDVLYDLFIQSKKNFVLDEGLAQSLYLNLEGLPFQKALDAIAVSTQIGYELRGEIYFIGKNRALPTLVNADPVLESSKTVIESALVAKATAELNERVVDEPPVIPTVTKPVEAPPLAYSGNTEESKTTKIGKLPQDVLNRKLTTRLTMTEIKQVFNEFGKQTGVMIEIDPTVPAYKIDAFLLGTSLRYALDVICDATKLEWSFTDKMTIKIAPKKS